MPSESELPTISVQGVSVRYRTTFEKRPTLKSALSRLRKDKRIVREIKAVNDVTFDVAHGTSLAVIGSNGAGKSTLVRAIAGILPPSAGRIEVRGRVSTLLSLGVGFNKRLTGYENVVLGGLAAGYSRREIESKVDEIAEWTELGEFLEVPVNTYSAGMYSRLAFAVAVHMEPDILLIDEALSTGDAHFKAKAAAKMDELREMAHTMVLVSHSMRTIKQLCNQAVWIDSGNLRAIGPTEEVVEQYVSASNVDANSAAAMEDF